MAKKIKVLIVDDAAFIVKAVTGILESDPNLEVIGVARNGLDGLEKIKLFKPDVVTLDVDMPIMDGIRAIRHIMIQAPVPIVMLSSLYSHGDITFEALRLGVVDFMPKPSGAISKDIAAAGHAIIERIKLAASMKLENVQRVRLRPHPLISEIPDQPPSCLVAIGTTLGGPNTIIRMMASLDPYLPAAAVTIQDVAPRILPELVKEFNRYTPWQIEIAEAGKAIKAGHCYLCSYEQPYEIVQDKNNQPILQPQTGEERPLNTLFKSTAECFADNSIGLLLTGIGDDGVEGLGVIKNSLGVTIAQESTTCVYPNLTQCAQESGHVDFIVAGNDLYRRIETTIRIKVGTLGHSE